MKKKQELYFLILTIFNVKASYEMSLFVTKVHDAGCIEKITHDSSNHIVHKFILISTFVQKSATNIHGWERLK